MRKKFILPVIVGPTAVGKTAVAAALAEQFDAEIVSADSRQIYEGLTIGSGAPSAEELRRVRHHLVGTVSPEKRLSAGEFARLALEAIDNVRARGKLPLVVGGSGLYIRALIDGLAPIPAPDPELRRRIDEEIDLRGMAALIEELRSVDPEYARYVGANDRKRLIRALEVWRMTGRCFTDWHRQTVAEQPFQPVFYGLSRPRDELWQLIERRVKAMLNGGWIEETRYLAERFGGLDRLPPSVTECLGYRHVVRLLLGEITRSQTEEAVIIATRQFAKRQMTWFRADNRVEWRELSGKDAPKKWTDWIEEEINEVTGAYFFKLDY